MKSTLLFICASLLLGNVVSAQSTATITNWKSIPKHDVNEANTAGFWSNANPSNYGAVCGASEAAKFTTSRDASSITPSDYVGYQFPTAATSAKKFAFSLVNRENVDDQPASNDIIIKEKVGGSWSEVARFRTVARGSSGNSCTSYEYTLNNAATMVIMYQLEHSGGNDDIYIGATTVTYSSGVLPVTGLNITAQLQNGTPQVSFTTLTEINTSIFEIEKSTNGSDFKTIAKLNAAGNSLLKQTYTYSDVTPGAAVVYYRVKATDKDGTITLSNVFTLRTSSSVSKVSVFPNPVTNQINIETAAAGTYFVELFSNDGRKVASQKFQNATGVMNLPLNRSAIVAGTYQLKVTQAENNQSSITKILVN